VPGHHGRKLEGRQVDVGVHVLLMIFGEDLHSPERLGMVVDTARDSGFAAVAAHHHFVYQTA
jgi:hypothetical protein